MSDDGGPAFPFADVYGPGGEGIREGSSGMSLRDWLAAQAPIDIPIVVGAMGGGYVEWNKNDRRAAVFAVAALLRYEWADAMLAARKEGSS